MSTRRLSHELPRGARRGRDLLRRKPRRKRHRRYVDPARTKPLADLIDGFSEFAILRLTILVGRLRGCVLILCRMPCGSASRHCCRPFPSVAFTTPDVCAFRIG